MSALADWASSARPTYPRMSLRPRAARPDSARYSRCLPRRPMTRGSERSAR